MMIVGLTGGIGSGKSTVAKMFADLGIPTYIADDEAKKLMHSSPDVKKRLVDLFGKGAYINGKLNKPFISDLIFYDKSLLKKMNAIVHPAVGSHFKTWQSSQNAPYVLKEAAIIFEINAQKQYDYIITVIADQELRIKRVMERDNSDHEKVISIINNQLSDAEKTKLSDFVIENNNLEQTSKQVQNIHFKLLKLGV
ncbi:MAG: dephospho-CoA kinase [Bacteroidetes bacterium MedPE-SWsnd-G2]|nr:MAG: dephospho-CoA kinase [Bacteroidetes bacterium MedPE-SWsnd-G2]